jgi:succinyl-diaminopimelate desuccinylase
LSFDGTGDVFLSEPGRLLATAIDAVVAVTGKTPKLSTGGGTSDARFIHAYCPVIELGLVNKTIHQVDEHTPVSDLERLTEIYSAFLTRYFAAAG